MPRLRLSLKSLTTKDGWREEGEGASGQSATHDFPAFNMQSMAADFKKRFVKHGPEVVLAC